MISLFAFLSMFASPVSAPAVSEEPVTITYAAGYIPNIQFAPFYVAMVRGYYEEEGIKLKMDYTIGSEAVKMVALKKVEIGSVDPDSFLLAMDQKMPLTHIATLFQTYPIALIAKEPILNAKNLRNKRVGVFGTYGASYLGLKAMLAEMGLTLSDIRVAAIGFNQVTSLKNNHVDAVVGYVNNEPLRLNGIGITTYTRMLSGRNSIPGAGLMAQNDWYAKNKGLVQKFLRATFKGMRDVLMDPDGCFKLVVKHYLPELTGERARTELDVLRETLPFWESAYVKKHGFGQCPPESWRNLAILLGGKGSKNPYLEWDKWVDTSFVLPFEE